MLVIIRGEAVIIAGDPDKAHITEQDNVMSQLTELLGMRIAGVKIGGYWVILVDGEVVSGDEARGQKRRRKLSRALADGLNRVVVTQVS